MIKGMKFIHVNTRSLLSKLNQMDLLYNDIDIICCSETWLDNRIGNGLVTLNGKTIFRCDRRSNLTSYNSRPTAGGVCIYVDNKYANFTTCISEFTKVTIDFEILTLFTKRPNHRFFVTICVYKPPKGDIIKCINFLKNILAARFVSNSEVWILGDFNTDLLKRGDIKTIMS